MLSNLPVSMFLTSLPNKLSHSKPVANQIQCVTGNTFSLRLHPAITPTCNKVQSLVIPKFHLPQSPTPKLKHSSSLKAILLPFPEHLLTQCWPLTPYTQTTSYHPYLIRQQNCYQISQAHAIPTTKNVYRLAQQLSILWICLIVTWSLSRYI